MSSQRLGTAAAAMKRNPADQRSSYMFIGMIRFIRSLLDLRCGADIERVVNMAHRIYDESDDTFRSTLDLRTIHLAALLHDVGDRKYLLPGQDPSTLIQSVLLSQDCPAKLAEDIQKICSGVSYTSETRDPAKVASLIEEFAELAVVQDADRLDAIGAVGIGRMFTFGGAKTDRSMGETMMHVDDKLLKLEGMMKTRVGKEVAKRRAERLRLFKMWWHEESGPAGLRG